MNSDPIVQLSALEHHLYCPRQCALIHVDGIWQENAHTVIGSRAHRRVDNAPSRQERGLLMLRALPLYSEIYGLSGRADAVEAHEDGSFVPVEYKSGVRHGEAADIQLCAQALCLEEMAGRPIDHGFIWYGGPRRRIEVRLTAALRLKTIEAIEAVRKALVTGVLPPAVADARCSECQLEPICMPKVLIRADRVRDYVSSEVFGCD